MYKQNGSDLDYTDGCIYTYQTSFPHVNTTYEYYFNCSDGLFSNTTGTYSGPTCGRE